MSVCVIGSIGISYSYSDAGVARVFVDSNFVYANNLFYGGDNDDFNFRIIDTYSVETAGWYIRFLREYLRDRL